MYILINHNLIHNDHTHNLFHDQNHLHPAIVVDKQNGGKTAQKAEKGDAVFDQNGKNGYFKNHDDVDNDQNDYLSNFKKILMTKPEKSKAEIPVVFREARIATGAREATFSLLGF